MADISFSNNSILTLSAFEFDHLGGIVTGLIYHKTLEKMGAQRDNASTTREEN